MKQAQVFKRKKNLFVLPSSQTTMGLWVGTDPVVKLEENVSQEEQGEAILHALSLSKHGVPHPSDWNIPTNSLLQVAGARSWNEFEGNAKSIVIELDDECLHIMPSRNLGSGNGFEPLTPNKDIELPAPATTREIGAALAEALKRCQ